MLPIKTMYTEVEMATYKKSHFRQHALLWLSLARWGWRLLFPPAPSLHSPPFALLHTGACPQQPAGGCVRAGWAERTSGGGTCQACSGTAKAAEGAFLPSLIPPAKGSSGSICSWVSWKSPEQQLKKNIDFFLKHCPHVPLIGRHARGYLSLYYNIF